MSLRSLRSPRLGAGSTLTGPRSRRRAVAVLTAIGLTAGITLLDQSPAGAAGPVSQSQGTFVNGSVLGTSLGDVAAIDPAVASNAGGAQVIDNHPLDITALNAVNVSLGSGINLLGSNGILSLGAVAQYAQANPDGSSRAAAGAITNSGGIAVGGSPNFPANASLSLKGLIGPGLASTLGDLNLSTGALSATATQTAAGDQSGTYQIADLNLDLTSPLVAGITNDLSGAVAGLQQSVNSLAALIRALPAVGLLASISLPNLSAVLNSIHTVTTADGAVTANLQTGAVSVDLAKFLASLGLDLNNLAPDTSLLPYITQALTNDLLPALAQDITTQFSAAINATTVSVLGVPIVLPAITTLLQGVAGQVAAPISSAVAGLGNSVVTPLANALSNVLSLNANVKETAAGAFTETALRVGLLPTAAPAAAVVNLAAATVGPNAGPAVAPTATGLDPDHGPAAGGQVVTVTGSGFVPGSTSVTIGGNTIPAGEVTVTSPTTLTFTTP
ncbi:MAG: choice-of-anchor G family protein, partial [Antricoccus sp.]